MCVLPLAALASESQLTAVFQPLQIELTKPQKQKLLRILSSALETEVVFAPSHYNGEPDILLTTNGEESETRFRAHYTIDQIPEFISISKKAPVGPTFVGQHAVRYKLTERDYYPVESVDTAVNMLLSGRLTSVVDVRGNEFYYRLKSDKFEVVSIRPVSYLYVDFKQQKLATKFDQQIIAFSNLTDVRAAAGPDEDAKQLTLIRIGKSYDAKKQRLVASEDEVKASEWFQQNLPEFNIDIVDTNSITTLERLQKGEQLCALNVRKNKEREAVGQFTLPSRVFLSLKLFAKRTLPQFSELVQLQHNDVVIDLAKFLERHPDGLVALPDGFRRYDSLSGRLKSYFSANINRFVRVKRQDNLKGLQLLRQDRVDYLVEFPTTIKAYMDEYSDIDQYDSFEISRNAAFTTTHIVCSKNATGNAATAAINRLISDVDKRAELIAIYTEGLTQSDSKRFKQAFESVIENTNL